MNEHLGSYVQKDTSVFFFQLHLFFEYSDTPNKQVSKHLGPLAADFINPASPARGRVLGIKGETPGPRAVSLSKFPKPQGLFRVIPFFARKKVVHSLEQSPPVCLTQETSPGFKWLSSLQSKLRQPILRKRHSHVYPSRAALHNPGCTLESPEGFYFFSVL